GKIGILVEVANALGFAVDLKDEVVLGEVLDQGSFFVADDDGEVDQAGVYSDGCGSGGGGWFGAGRLLLLRGKARGDQARRKENAGHESRPERAEGDHMDLDDV